MARKKKPCLKDASCSEGMVSSARKQAEHLLHEAEGGKKRRSRTCSGKLKEARVSFSDAEKIQGDVLTRRNAFIRATFLAGQAKACTVIEANPTQRKGRRKKAV